MHIDDSLFPQTILEEQAALAVLSCNAESSRFGLILTPKEAHELVVYRNATLQSFGRIELAGGSLARLINVFADSPFLDPATYYETLGELTETFYYFKNETEDTVSDDDLLTCMKKLFDGKCRGSVDLLQSLYLEELARHIRSDGANEGDIDEK